ncbi:hypothetical protein PHALS_01640 [Plasmopara halstedii]|uniref:Uncharacterized protein n=1 Tax=Plasmopara halstedii TaxID=4781 RepID=A0A0P1AX71_PLAHL|nr:hypothetical protein PHALS_01640 [Plasmopara halstedii]|eukprot:XP_024581705.1 hypothetical protein PHALS_01640 [Plasmopara halstedii]
MIFTFPQDLCSHGGLRHIHTRPFHALKDIKVNSLLPVNAMKLNRFIAQKRDPHSYYDSTKCQPEDCIDFNLINDTRPTNSWVFMHVLALELLRLSK